MHNQNRTTQFLNIKYFYLIVIIIGLFSAVYIFSLKEDPIKKSKNLTHNKQENIGLISEKNTETTSNETQLDKTYSANVYESEAISIDEEFDERFENQFPVIPVHKLENEFQSKSDVDEYLNEIFSSINSHTLESIELASLCNNKNQTISFAKKKGNQKMLEFYDVLFDKCALVTGDNDIFFIVEKLAIKGDSFERLNYLNNLNNAIFRGIVKPMVNPYDYIEKRELAIGWLQQLAAKGVVQAYENLASLYRSGHNIERDNVLAYYYASLAMKHALVTDYSEIYLENLKSELTEKELDRLNRLLKN